MPLNPIQQNLQQMQIVQLQKFSQNFGASDPLAEISKQFPIGSEQQQFMSQYPHAYNSYQGHPQIEQNNMGYSQGYPPQGPTQGDSYGQQSIPQQVWSQLRQVGQNEPLSAGLPQTNFSQSYQGFSANQATSKYLPQPFPSQPLQQQSHHSYGMSDNDSSNFLQHQHSSPVKPMTKELDNFLLGNNS